MLYLERLPHPALAPFIKTLWYACDPHATHRHERVLPNGHAQIVISLARDYLTDANHPTDPLQHSPAAILTSDSPQKNRTVGLVTIGTWTRVRSRQ